jgi:hypothetical protein
MANDERIPEKEAGYMELQGARKDADCRKVAVKGGVSSALGCCNHFEPESRATRKFTCGTCEYLISEGKDYFFDG